MMPPSGFRAHPWHGVAPGPKPPALVTAYIELVPTDTVKYEVDKETGILRLDRPQKFSNVCPTLYGFIPRTFCDARVAALCAERTQLDGLRGDGDPLDICVLSERTLSHGDVLVRAVPIGGLRMVDHKDVDDKIIAVLEGDAVYGGWKDVTDCSQALIDRLRHYFLTYKQPPDRPRPVDIHEVYGRADAHRVIEASLEDYRARFCGS